MLSTNNAGGTTFTTPSDLEVLITRVVDAPRELVFLAWTSPQHLSQWMLGPEGWTMPVCEIDLRAGGGFRYVWRRSSGTEVEIRGVFNEIAPPERLVSTESWGGEWPDTLNTLVLSETDGKTMMALSVRYPSKEARDAAFEPDMQDGMSRSFDRLDEHVRTMV